MEPLVGFHPLSIIFNVCNQLPYDDARLFSLSSNIIIRIIIKNNKHSLILV